MQHTRKTYAEYLNEIKENCPQMRNIAIPHKSTFMQEINGLASQIPFEKKPSLVKLCIQQEQKIYQSIHNIKQYNLLQEIGRVNPQLQKELKDTKTQELPSKLEHYQQVKMINDAESDYSQESTNYLKNMHEEEKHYHYDIHDSYRKRPMMRNLMDEYEKNDSEFSDIYISKYFDLN